MIIAGPGAHMGLSQGQKDTVVGSTTQPCPDLQCFLYLSPTSRVRRALSSATSNPFPNQVGGK